MKKIGTFALTLHSHLPYARLAGRWPHGEEWLHEAAAGTYIPLLNLLYELMDNGVQARVTITLTPVLLEQLSDTTIQENFRIYMRERITAVELDLERFRSSHALDYEKLALHYLRRYEAILGAFDQSYKGDLVSAFRRLQDEGMIEIATCAATHAFLPLLAHDESIHLQLRTAVESYQRHFGRPPRSMWLPECAYRPAITSPTGEARKGLEDFLSQYNLKLFFSETDMVENGSRIEVPQAPESEPPLWRRLVTKILRRRRKLNSTFQAYQVSESDVVVLARNRQVCLQVWSADWGYPGEAAYREFHKKDGQSGTRYWRVTGRGVDLGQKEIYDLDLAADKVEAHAEHFHDLLHKELRAYRKSSEHSGIIAANFDTELFGHWWYEGVDWLAAVLRRLASSEEIELITAADHIIAEPPQIALDLPEGSWGDGGHYAVWDNEKTRWMWPVIHDAEARMADLVQQYATTQGAERQVLDQIGRELLLLQSSDWPFLVTTGQADRYAARRFLEHVERFNHLIRQLQSDDPDPILVEELWERDNIFPDLEYRWFGR